MFLTTAVVLLAFEPTYLGFRVERGEQELVAVRGDRVCVIHRPKPASEPDDQTDRCFWFTVSPSERYILSYEWVVVPHESQARRWAVRRLVPGAPRVSVIPPAGTWAAWVSGDRIRYCTYAHPKHPVAGGPFTIGCDVWELAPPFKASKLIGRAKDELDASWRFYGRGWLRRNKLMPRSAGRREEVFARAAFLYANDLTVPDRETSSTAYVEGHSVWLYDWRSKQNRLVSSGVGVSTGWLRSAGAGRASWTVQPITKGSAFDWDGNVTDAYQPASPRQTYATFVLDMRTGVLRVVYGLAAAVQLDKPHSWP